MDRSSPPTSADAVAFAAHDVDFDEVIDDVIDGLPSAFLNGLGSVAIVVEDEATPDQLASVRVPGSSG